MTSARVDHSKLVTPSPSRSATDSNSNCKRYTLIALGIIILIGSLTASCYLYSQLGYWSLAIGGAGLIIGSGLISLALCGCKKANSSSHQREQSSSEDNKITTEATGHITSLTSSSSQNSALGSSEHQITTIDFTNLPKTLPKEAATSWGISETSWLTIGQLQRYITYLATEFPIAVDCQPITYTIDSLAKTIEYNAISIPNFQDLNLPICLNVSGNHWTLVYIDREKRTVEYYDSKKDYGNHDEIKQKLIEFANKLSNEEPDERPYKFECKINKVLQPDGYQCGPLVLYFLEKRLKDPEFNFNQISDAQNSIKEYRNKVRTKLIEMYHAVEVVAKKEKENYKNYYKDESEAIAMYHQDLNQLTYVERWRQTLSGRLLVPSP